MMDEHNLDLQIANLEGLLVALRTCKRLLGQAQPLAPIPRAADPVEINPWNSKDSNAVANPTPAPTPRRSNGQHTWLDTWQTRARDLGNVLYRRKHPDVLQVRPKLNDFDTLLTEFGYSLKIKKGDRAIAGNLKEFIKTWVSSQSATKLMKDIAAECGISAATLYRLTGKADRRASLISAIKVVAAAGYTIEITKTEDP